MKIIITISVFFRQDYICVVDRAQAFLLVFVSYIMFIFIFFYVGNMLVLRVRVGGIADLAANKENRCTFALLSLIRV